MKKTLGKLLLIGICVCTCGILHAQKENKEIEYAIITSQEIANNSEWKPVIQALLDKHSGAVVCYYQDSLRETLSDLQKYKPRYVAVVEKPEHIDYKYVMTLNRMSREIDNDIFADFMYGIITGFNAQAALRMVNDASTPFVINSAMVTTRDLAGKNLFDSYVYIDEKTLGFFLEKEVGQEEKRDTMPYIEGILNGEPSVAYAVISSFMSSFNKHDPDLLITTTAASEEFLDTPYNGGLIKVREDGTLYADEIQPLDLKKSEKRRIYLPVGSNMIGNVNNTRNSMAIAWMNYGQVDAMAAYVTKAWYGRASWGGLKYWITTPGRYTLAEAYHLNQQDILFQLNEWVPQLQDKSCANEAEGFQIIKQILQREPTKDEYGFFYDRDALAIYGDPAWNARIKELPEENDFTVTSKIQGRKCTITVQTKENFNLERMKGNHFMEANVKDLPFSYIFPQRLKNPRLASKQSWKAAVDENFLLLYNANFKPSKTYKIVLNIDK